MAENSNGLVELGGEVKIPVGGDFTPSGMIAQWKASVMYSFYSKVDLNVDEVGTPDGLIIRPMGNSGFRYYHKSLEALTPVKDALGEQFNPNQVWVWSAPRSTVLNVSEEHLAKFSDPVTMELKITTLGSKKSRHELHMIALPAMVHSIAGALGYNPPEISFSMLIGNQVIFDDAFQHSLIGNPDVASADLNGHYTKSLLWQQRLGLWLALGEKDATKYYPKDKGTKYDTSSEKLSNCLNYLTHDWAGGMWARVVQVPDPRVDAVYGDDKRLTIPAMVEIFASQAEATKVALKENAERAQREASKNGGSVASEPVAGIPEAWKDNPTEWRDWINNEVRSKTVGMPLPAAVAYVTKLVADFEASGQNIGATAAEIMTALKQ